MNRLGVIVGGFVGKVGPENAFGHGTGVLIGMFQEGEQGGELEGVRLGDDSGGENAGDGGGGAWVPDHGVELLLKHGWWRGGCGRGVDPGLFLSAESLGQGQ
ncbi:MAG: hypothetical protein EBT07_08725 [Actinobacteria bacterium]|nr:hypothetical protein [Actinomycetota bacterium]